MNQDELDAFRELLKVRKVEIEDLNSSSKESADTVLLDQSKVGRLSRMDALQAQQMAQELRRRRQIQLKKIDSALRRMEKGDFGYCTVCGDEISAGRLNFDPASTRCVECMGN